MGKLIWGLVLCLVSILFYGCSYRPILKGEFEAEPPQNFVGVGKELPKNSTLNGFTVSGVYVPNIRMHVDNLYNVYPGDGDGEGRIKGAKVNFWYELDKFPVMASYTKLFKMDQVVGGFSLNVGKNFFGRFIYGLNRKNYEAGVYGDIGYGFNKSHYIFMPGCYNSLDKYNNCSVDTVSVTQGHFVSSFGAYFSAYFDDFGFTYSPMAYGPWRAAYLDAYYNSDINLEFDFPLIFSHYVGISFWLMDHWKFTGGASFLHAWEYEKFYVIGNASIGYWF